MYERLAFEQYFIDVSQEYFRRNPIVQELVPSTKFKYNEITYTHGKHTHNAYYAVLPNKKRNVIQVFLKETTDNTGWKANFECAEKYYDSFDWNGHKIQLKVYSGWAEMYTAMKHLIRDKVSLLMNKMPDADIEVIGWSLGSAMAQLCAQDLYFNLGIKVHLFTYGSVKPWRSTDKYVKEYLSQCYAECWNFRDHNDIVGYLPPLVGYFCLNKVVIKQNRFCIFRLFNPNKYHTEYWKSDYYKSI